ncbi:TetR/AcrR family transcriptional regulator [Luteipulveratus mongoliensis]|uniref:TetR family transcriptional regulator n=1 Tax=Luteipulveratus mongoliensis TaxID=571913 RepID=A0A0K1JDG6_9MICO|nr:TetR/AcrR family transcriptional regulator [Luteipulveratus mongoliensis]AKU14653.1 TetR family transcriptional regulator [Luteipulveratus mongoliensis]
MEGSIWTRSAPSSSPRETLSREQIVRAAVKLLDEEGLAGLSMRKLAGRLESGTTSLYWHVSTKDDLLDLVIDEIYGEVDVPEPDLAGWRGGVTLLAHSLRSMVLRHPWVPSAIFGRANVGPNAMTSGAGGLRLFEAAGFEGLEIDKALSSVFAYVFGITTAEVAWRGAVRSSGRSTEEWADRMYEDVMSVTNEYPAMRDAVARRASIDIEQLQSDSFVFGLESMLDGLEHRLAHRA